MTERQESAANRSKPGCKTVAVFLLLIAVGCARTPQVIDDPDVYKSVDALWTAMTARKPELLEQVAVRLQKQHEERRLSAQGHARLLQIIARGRAQQWDDGLVQLRALIKAQRPPQAD